MRARPSQLRQATTDVTRSGGDRGPSGPSRSAKHSAWTTRGEPEDAAGWQHEWDLLAAGPMGRAAICIAEQVRAAQGPDGLYETRHVELTAGRPRT